MLRKRRWSWQTKFAYPENWKPLFKNWVDFSPESAGVKSAEGRGKVGHLATAALPKGQDGGAQTTSSRCSESKSLECSPPKVEAVVALTCLRSAVRMQRRKR